MLRLAQDAAEAATGAHWLGQGAAGGEVKAFQQIQGAGGHALLHLQSRTAGVHPLRIAA